MDLSGYLQRGHAGVILEQVNLCAPRVIISFVVRSGNLTGEGTESNLGLDVFDILPSYDMLYHDLLNVRWIQITY